MNSAISYLNHKHGANVNHNCNMVHSLIFESDASYSLILKGTFICKLKTASILKRTLELNEILLILSLLIILIWIIRGTDNTRTRRIIGFSQIVQWVRLAG